MNELKHLISMWSPKVKRKTDLIIPEVTYSELEGTLNNCSWVFNVSFAFRSALDIKYEQRKKDKKAYMVWTQGPLIGFKEGDLIHSQDGLRALQVRIAKPISWDIEKKEMYQGYLLFDELKFSNSVVFEIKQYTCTQMQFLEILIYGIMDNATEHQPGLTDSLSENNTT